MMCKENWMGTLNMTHKIFRICVLILVFLAKKLNTTYESLNVWIFCVIMPSVFILLIGIIMYLL